jgi:hypothetical protein
MAKLMSRERRFCDICGRMCFRGECFACGLPVCTDKECSRRMKWYRYNRRRVCIHCQEENERMKA